MIDLSKRYILFIVEPYYPSGGMSDAVGSFNNLLELHAYIKEHADLEWQRWNAFDTVERKIIKEEDEDSTGVQVT